jgi:predicted metal-dependent HD superfamily phosphohydrolase
MNSPYDQLKATFLHHLKRAGAGPVPSSLFSELHQLYAGPGRHYHGVAHLDHCVRELQQSPTPDNAAVALAIWFHDAIYDPMRSDNEERSADLAVERLRDLRVSLPVVNDVRRLILVTTHKELPTQADEQLIADIDLAILGQPQPTFEAYERAIRREYEHVADEDFRKGRAGILENFLNRHAIYHLPHFKMRYEIPARQNLTRSLMALKGNGVK